MTKKQVTTTRSIAQDGLVAVVPGEDAVVAEDAAGVMAEAEEAMAPDAMRPSNVITVAFEDISLVTAGNRAVEHMKIILTITMTFLEIMVRHFAVHRAAMKRAPEPYQMVGK